MPAPAPLTKAFLRGCTIASVVFAQGCDASFEPHWQEPDARGLPPPTFDSGVGPVTPFDAGTLFDAGVGDADPAGPLKRISCALVVSGGSPDAACSADCSGLCTALCTDTASCADADVWVPCANCVPDSGNNDPPPTL